MNQTKPRTAIFPTTLKIKTSCLGFGDKFFVGGQLVATCGGGALVFNNGTNDVLYLLDNEDNEDIRELVYCRYEVVPKGSTDWSYYDGAYYKETEATVVAHVDTTSLASGSEWTIIYGDEKYKVVHTKKTLSRISEIYENNEVIGWLTGRIFSVRSHFVKRMSLEDKVIITFLACPY